jgi:predicted PurR-regulated permease PerM
MLKKQFNKAVIIITILVVGVFIGLVNKAGANETTQIVPEPKPLHFKVQDWAQNEWNDIKTYQAENWANGKEQLNRNKQQVSNLFQNIADAISNIATTTEKQ